MFVLKEVDLETGNDQSQEQVSVQMMGVVVELWEVQLRVMAELWAGRLLVVAEGLELVQEEEDQLAEPLPLEAGEQEHAPVAEGVDVTSH